MQTPYEQQFTLFNGNEGEKEEDGRDSNLISLRLVAVPNKCFNHRFMIGTFLREIILHICIFGHKIHS